jgi:hypothetical protein
MKTPALTAKDIMAFVPEFDGVRVRDPQDYPCGKREIHLTDPCGVLWHIAVSID